MRRRVQCLKCRIPVNTIASPRSSAAAIISASRIDPPGWTTAVAPAQNLAGNEPLGPRHSVDPACR